jgi:hypothetical protein
MASAASLIEYAALAHSHAAWPMLRQHAWGMNAHGLLLLMLGSATPKVGRTPKGGEFYPEEKRVGTHTPRCSCTIKKRNTPFCLHDEKSKIGKEDP